VSWHSGLPGHFFYTLFKRGVTFTVLHINTHQHTSTHINTSNTYQTHINSLFFSLPISYCLCLLCFVLFSFIFTLFLFYFHFIFALFLFYFCFIFVLFSCYFHVILCYFHIIFLLFLCYFRVIFVLFLGYFCFSCYILSLCLELRCSGVFDVSFFRCSERHTFFLVTHT
jgi:hypothetical protein